MKKLLAAIAILAVAISTYGQGRVNFANTSSTLITNGTTGAAITGAGTYYFALYVGSLGTAENALTPVLTATNTALAGRLTGGNPVALPAPYDVAGAYPLTFQVRGWLASAGSTYAEAFANGGASVTGRSALGTVSPTFSPTGAAALFGDPAVTAGVIRGFTVGVIPEPSSIALGLLGLGAVALFRRRK